MSQNKVQFQIYVSIVMPYEKDVINVFADLNTGHRKVIIITIWLSIHNSTNKASIRAKCTQTLQKCL